MPSGSKGFTLIELLVVIAVLAILAAIIFPAYAAAREKAQMGVCLSNLKQIGIAIQTYVDDYEGGYPNTGNALLWMGRYWRWPLKPYLGLSADPVPGDPLHSTGGGRNILLCPSDYKGIESYDSTSYSYSMCFYVSPSRINSISTFAGTVTAPGPTCTTQRQSSVAYPSQKVLVTEWISNHEKPNVGWNDPATAWEGGRCCLFADGHTSYLQSKKINPANDNLPDINLTRDGIHGKDIE